MPLTFKALHAYTGDPAASQLTFQACARLCVDDDPNHQQNGWMFGYLQASPHQRGWFPTTYVTQVQDPVVQSSSSGGSFGYPSNDSTYAAPNPFASNSEPHTTSHHSSAMDDGGFGGGAVMGGTTASVSPARNVVKHHAPVPAAETASTFSSTTSVEPIVNPENPPGWPGNAVAVPAKVDWNDDTGGFGGSAMGGAAMPTNEIPESSGAATSTKANAAPKEPERFITISVPEPRKGLFHGVKKRLGGKSNK